MKRLLVALVAGLVLLGLVVTPSIAGKHGPAGKSNVAHLYLYEKDPSNWSIVDGGAWGKMKYNPSGPEFCFVFNGHGLETETAYSLIYYADPWPGNNPGAPIASGTSNDEGNIHLAGCKDLDMDLPDPYDANANEATCQGAPCPGAKIWLVLSDDYDDDERKMVGWDPSEYLFEHNLITYDDTDVP